MDYKKTTSSCCGSHSDSPCSCQGTGNSANDPEDTRELIRSVYGGIAASEENGQSCCGNNVENTITLKEAASQLGYTNKEIADLPEGVTLSLGCGNPLALASLKPGETVLDLGSGAGFDCAIAAERIGEKGAVIGVDMTAEMRTKARRNLATKKNIEFRLGEIEHLPVADRTVDVIISNCVINLSSQKEQVFAEAFRVLKPGGRLAISDVIRIASFEDTRWEGTAHICECISGSVTAEELELMLENAGFEDIRIVGKEESSNFIKNWDPDTGVENYVRSALIEAKQPVGTPENLSQK